MKDQRPAALRNAGNQENNETRTVQSSNPQPETTAMDNGKLPLNNKMPATDASAQPDSVMEEYRKVNAAKHAARVLTEESDTASEEPQKEAAHQGSKQVTQGEKGGVSYKILGDDIQMVEIILKPNQSVVGDIEGLLYMEQGVTMKTKMSSAGVPQKQGFLQKLLGLGKGLLTGEQMFVMTYTNTANKHRKIAFTQPKAGSVEVLDLATVGGSIMCLKGSLLCAGDQVRISSASQRDIGSGLFGSGVEMQTLQGQGVIFVHSGGVVTSHEIPTGETMNVTLGSVLMKQVRVDLSTKTIPNVGLTGEGFKIVTLKGPGKVWIQSLPIIKLQEKVALFTESFLKKRKKKK